MTDTSTSTVKALPRPNKFLDALSDLSEGAQRWPLWTAFAWEDIKSTYRRSMFGVLWITLSFAAFAAVKLLIFGSMIGDVDANYFGTYLLLGFFAWQFMSAVVTSSPMIFTSNEGWIKNDPLPYSIFIYQATTRHLFNLFFTFIVVIGFCLYFQQTLTWHAWLFIPAVLVYILNALWVQILLGVLCTRYRDFTHLVQTIMRFMFFLTPIFWLPAQMGRLMEILWWNPFAHFLWILRTPVIDHTLAVDSWIFVGIVTVVGWTAALTAFALYRRRIPFWF